jgi:hypothetical protein
MDRGLRKDKAWVMTTQVSDGSEGCVGLLFSLKARLVQTEQLIRVAVREGVCQASPGRGVHSPEGA